LPTCGGSTLQGEGLTTPRAPHRPPSTATRPASPHRHRIECLITRSGSHPAGGGRQSTRPSTPTATNLHRLHGQAAEHHVLAATEWPACRDSRCILRRGRRGCRWRGGICKIGDTSPSRRGGRNQPNCSYPAARAAASCTRQRRQRPAAPATTARPGAWETRGSACVRRPPRHLRRSRTPGFESGRRRASGAIASHLSHSSSRARDLTGPSGLAADGGGGRAAVAVSGLARCAGLPAASTEQATAAARRCRRLREGTPRRSCNGGGVAPFCLLLVDSDCFQIVNTRHDAKGGASAATGRRGGNGGNGGTGSREPSLLGCEVGTVGDGGDCGEGGKCRARAARSRAWRPSRLPQQHHDRLDGHNARARRGLPAAAPPAWRRQLRDRRRGRRQLALLGPPFPPARRGANFATSAGRARLPGDVDLGVSIVWIARHHLAAHTQGVERCPATTAHSLISTLIDWYPAKE